MRSEIQKINGNAGFQFDEIALAISLESQVKKQIFRTQLYNKCSRIKGLPIQSNKGRCLLFLRFKLKKQYPNYKCWASVK